MLNQFSRTQLLLGEENMNRLSEAKVAIFGIGGVGGYVAEALARSGVGSFVLVDDDKVCLTNINRQIIATRKTVGQYKVDVMKERILDINPKAEVEVRKCFYLPENAHEFDFSTYSYVVDAVDTVTAKIVTAVHNINTGFKRIFTHSRQFFHHFFCAVPDVDNLVFLCPSAVEQFCQLENVECTEHNVDKAVRLLDFFNNLCFLHHTAAQCDNHMRIFLF